MLRSVPVIALAIAILGQFAANLLAGALGAFAIPCCDNPTPEIPSWYAYISTPIDFLVMLLPAFLCGLYAASRPIFVGTVAAGVGAFLWRWFGHYVIAQLFPAWALGGVGVFNNAFWSISSGAFVAHLIISAVCYAAVGAGAASAGYLLRSRVRPNLSLNRTGSGGRPAAPAGTAG
jgi:hypothetical protein